MGEVYRARDSRLRREVALKILSEAGPGDREARHRLLREARTIAALNHPHICTVHDVGEADDVAYMAMELVDGETLYQAIRRARFPRRAPAESAASGRRVPLSDQVSSGRLSSTPDGGHVIFIGDSSRPGIYAVRADGRGGERKLLDISARRGALGVYGTPSDGKYVYFTWDEDLGDLWVMRAGR